MPPPTADRPHSPGGIPIFPHVASDYMVRMFTRGDKPETFSDFQHRVEDQFLAHMARSDDIEYHRTVALVTNKEFMALQHLYQGPNAIIVIGDEGSAEKWEIPKKLLCYHSDYFKDALLPNIKDDDKHTLYFEESISGAFAAIVRLIYTGTINFDKGPTPTSSITQYLDFFHLGERLDIEWARTKVDTIAMLIENILSKHKDALTSAHVQAAFNLPVDHPMRLFVAEVCYKHFLISNNFKFWKEWYEIPGFSSAILQASKEVVIDAGILAKDNPDWNYGDIEDEKVEEKPEVVDTRTKQNFKEKIGGRYDEISEELDAKVKKVQDLVTRIKKELEEEKENLLKMHMDG